MSKRLLLSCLLGVFSVWMISAQLPVRIFDITPIVSFSPDSVASISMPSRVMTQGIVTLKTETGYYIQDAQGDDNPLTNDAMFVFDTIYAHQVGVGDLLELLGNWQATSSHIVFELEQVPSVVAKGRQVSPTTVIFPDDFSSYTPYVGMTLYFDQTLVVTSNYSWQRYGQLTLSSYRLITPTQVEIPGSSAYYSLVAANNADQLVMDDGSSATYPNPLPYADADGTRRTGSKTTGLTAVLHSGSNGYSVVPTVTPQFFGNPRPDTVSQLGNYGLKVCAFNLCYYLASDYGTGYGPANATEAARQHQKILDACLAIDADIYGFVEIQTGQGAIAQLCSALNTATGTNNYAYVNDGTSTNGSYTKVGYVYRQDKVRADKEIQSLNTIVSNRKKAQGFTQLSNNESFIFVLEHYKSKSGTGTGDNADNGDGQGSYNANRVAEAEATVSFIERCKTYFGYDDVLIMGDLNAYAQEDPLQVLYDAGYLSMFEQFDGDTAYSYSYMAQVGCLDHILGNRTMVSQISGVKAFHINADEPSFLSYSGQYENNMYRSSDHDPIVCGLTLGQYNDSLWPVYGDNIYLYPNPTKDEVSIINAANYRLKIIDYNGTILYNEFVSEDVKTISTQALGLPSGVYLFQLIENKAIEPKTIVLKLIVS